MRFRGLYAVICLAAALAPVCAAQSESPPALLGLKTCGRELRLFDDGTVVVSRDGIKTERRLSKRRMRKLRRVIAGGPCEQEWQRPLPTQTTPSDAQLMTSTVYVGECMGSVLSYGVGLQEVLVTRHYPGYERGTHV